MVKEPLIWSKKQILVCSLKYLELKFMPCVWLEPILFGVTGLACFIYGGGGGQKCPTLVFSKLDMVWQWNLAHIEAILWQVKTNREFSELWIIFDGISTTLHNTVKFTIFYIYIIDGVSVNNSKELVNSTYLQHWINILRFFVVFRWCQVNFWVSKRVFLSLSLLRWCN